MKLWVRKNFLNYLLIFLTHSLLYSTIYFVGFGGLPSFIYTNPTVFYVAMILYSVSTMMNFMLLAIVFNNPLIAVVVSVILYYASFVAPLTWYYKFECTIQQITAKIIEVKLWRICLFIIYYLLFTIIINYLLQFTISFHY